MRSGPPRSAAPGHLLKLEIRAYDPRDQQEVWALHNAALEESGAHAGNGPWDDDLKDPIAAYRARPPAQAVLNL